MAERKIGALLIESGGSLDYFTGVRWRLSERTTAAIIPAHGEVLIVTPAFEEPSVRETLEVGGEVRSWNEADSPFARIVGGLKDRGVHSGSIAVEPNLRFFIIDGVRKASNRYEIVSGDPLIRACRLIKSPAELKLMQTANDVTITAMRYVRERIERGMSATDIGALMNAATVALGGTPEFALILLNEASAYPHGSVKPQSVSAGSVILMDCGCTVRGYQSDISRTWVYGEATARQVKVWNTVKRGQEIALETAKIGVATPLEAGMCFSDEPGIYIPGEFGMRLEDCWHMTAAGPVLFTGLAKSIDEPI
jgi:Xaa-Pro dipeptidase